MDSLTHLALGAVIGEACAGKALGKKAMLWGSILQSIPDVDFIASFILEPTDNLLAHRGITHSLLFDLVITLGGAFLLTRWKKSQQLNFHQWAIFIGIEVSVHLLLDAFNNYGVGWFEPFSDTRVSFNIIFVADPWFSAWAGIAALALLWLPKHHKSRIIWARSALIICSTYLSISCVNKFFINQKLEKAITRENTNYTRYFTAPTIFNNLLWYCVVESESGYYIGYLSVFDKSDRVDLTYFPRQRELLRGIENEKEIQNLIQFSKGFFTVEKQSDAFVFNDLRFGRVAGWTDQSTEFTFHYYLQRPEKNMLVVQRGRFAEINLKTARSLINRIRGE